MELYIIRHAWAEERDPTRWPDDDQRPLTTEGKRRFRRVLRRLVAAGMTPEVVAASPLKRCLQTAELLAATVEPRPKIIQLDALRPGSDLNSLLQWTARQAREHERIAWVGHAPDVDHLAAALIGGPEAAIHFSKGGIAALQFDGLPLAGGGVLQWLVSAKVLGC